MYVRLGFAVAAHLETEIILIDEVLAVGDAAFQKKCLGIGDVARQGRTVVFISHNMASVESLCDSCVYLSAGRLAESGSAHDVIAKYMASQTQANSGNVSLAGHPGRRPGYDPVLRTLDRGAPVPTLPSAPFRWATHSRYCCPSKLRDPAASRRRVHTENRSGRARMLAERPVLDAVE